MVEPVRESMTIAAAPQQVWELVSDVTRMGDWSPETHSCEWKGSAKGPRPGAQFTGANRNGRRRWSTTCVVTCAEPGQRFAFEVSSFGLPVAAWSYEMVATEDGCRLTETMVDRRQAPMRVIGKLATGVSDRATHNRETIRKTLAAIKAAAER